MINYLNWLRELCVNIAKSKVIIGYIKHTLGTINISKMRIGGLLGCLAWLAGSVIEITPCA